MKFLKILYYLLIGFIALIAIFLVISVFPIPGNFEVMTVLSGSMNPTIKMGSVVVVKPVDQYQIGDIITFKSSREDKAPITHRIHDIKVSGGVPVYITKGDANENPDQREVPKREIVGKVLFSVPYLGHVVDFAQRPIGFMIIIIVPAAVIIFDQVKNIFHQVKKIRTDKESSKLE